MLVVLIPKQNRGRSWQSIAHPNSMRSACDGYVFDVESVLALLMGLDDSRKARSKVYALAMILLLMLLAKLSGADSQRAMAQWLDKRKGELATMLKRQNADAVSDDLAANCHMGCLRGAIRSTFQSVPAAMGQRREQCHFEFGWQDLTRQHRSDTPQRRPFVGGVFARTRGGAFANGSGRQRK